MARKLHEVYVRVAWGSKYFYWIGLLLLTAIVFLIYAPVLNGKFVFDDYIYIVNNPAIRHLSHLSQIGNTAAIAQISRYVVLFSFALNYHFSQLNVFPYHLTNIFIHIATSLFVFWFIRLLFGTPWLISSDKNGRRDNVASLAAFLFALHPVQTQAVSYITQRCESLAVCFYMLSLCCYLKARLASSSYGRAVGFLVAGVAALLAMFSKETTITLPFMVILIEVLFFHGSVKKMCSGVKLWQLWTGFAVFLAFLLIIPSFFSFQAGAFFNQKYISQSHEGDVFTFGEYLLTQCRVAVTFLRLFFIPVGQNFDYDFLTSKTFFDPETSGCFILLAVIFAAAIKYGRYQGRLASFGILWFFLTFTPNLIPRANVIFEHKLYLLSMGLCMATAVLLYDVFQRKTKAFFIIGMGIAAILAVLTYQRNQVWKDEVSLWKDVVLKSPQKSRALNALGAALQNHGDENSSLDYLNRALMENPDNPEARNNRGVIYKNQGHDDLALEDFNKAIKMWPDYVAALNNRATLYQKKGQYDLAVADYERAMQLNPTYPEIYFNLAGIYKIKGKVDLALKMYDTLIAMSPSNSEAYNGQGILYADQKQYNLALADFEKAVKINPQSAAIYNNMGSVAFLQAKYDEAIDCYTKALGIDKDYADSLKNRAVAYKARKDFSSALRDYDAYLMLRPADVSAAQDRLMVFEILKNKK
ncbi:MAG: tetratricopeptide repeat protein [Candidatus Omnitrophica bacterium]|nr:tetratricopeptide repeat protein [Candidatus Omnitrophota bacterium]